LTKHQDYCEAFKVMANEQAAAAAATRVRVAVAKRKPATRPAASPPAQPPPSKRQFPEPGVTIDLTGLSNFQRQVQQQVQQQQQIHPASSAPTQAAAEAAVAKHRWKMQQLQLKMGMNANSNPVPPRPEKMAFAATSAAARTSWDLVHGNAAAIPVDTSTLANGSGGLATFMVSAGASSGRIARHRLLPSQHQFQTIESCAVTTG
jgi:hypothetical protein